MKQETPREQTVRLRALRTIPTFQRSSGMLRRLGCLPSQYDLDFAGRVRLNPSIIQDSNTVETS